MLKNILIIVTTLSLSYQTMAGNFVRPQVTDTANTHNIENGLEIEISEKGFEYLTQHLDKMGSALGFNLKNNQLDSVSKELPPISLSEYAKKNPKAAAIIKNLNEIANYIIGIQIEDPQARFDAQKMSYNINYSKIQIAPMPELVGEHKKNDGSIGFVLKVIIEGFNLSSGLSVITDKTNPLVHMEIEDADIELMSPSIYFTLPFIIKSNGDATFDITVSKGHTNVEDADIRFDYKKILRPYNPITVGSDCSHMSKLSQELCADKLEGLLDNEKIIKKIEDTIPKVMDYAKSYITEFTETKITELLSDEDGNQFNKSVTSKPIIEYMPIDPIGKKASNRENYYDTNIDAFKVGDRRLKEQVNFKKLDTCLSEKIFYEKDELDQQIAFVSQETLFSCFGIASLSAEELQFWNSNKINYLQAKVCAYQYKDSETELIDTKVALNCIGDSSIGFNLKANHFSSGTTNGLNLGFDISIEDMNSVYGSELDKPGAFTVLNQNYGQKTNFAKHAPKGLDNNYDFEVAVAINSKVINSLVTKSFERGYFNQMDSTKTSEEAWRSKKCRINKKKVDDTSNYTFGNHYNAPKKLVTNTEQSSLIMSRPPVIVTQVSELNNEAINNHNSAFWASNKYKNIKRIFESGKLSDEELFLKLNVEVIHEREGFLQSIFLDKVTRIQMDLILLVKKIHGTGQLGLFMVDYDPDSIEVPSEGKFVSGKVKKEVVSTMKCALDEWINHPTSETSSEYGFALMPVIPLDKEIRGVSLNPKKLTVDENGNLIMYSNFNRAETIATEKN